MGGREGQETTCTHTRRLSEGSLRRGGIAPLGAVIVARTVSGQMSRGPARTVRALVRLRRNATQAAPRRESYSSKSNATRAVNRLAEILDGNVKTSE